jgi:hypothetical protein
MDNTNYDYIIVGADLTGIALAWYLSKTDKKILLIDKNMKIGGLNRFDIIDNKIVLHTPQIYSNCYLSFIDLLTDMNLDFYNLFIKSNRNFLQDLRLSIYESLILFINLFYLTFDLNYGSDISIHDFLIKNNFSIRTYNNIDNVVNIIFSSDVINISLNQFLSFYNFNYYYNFYHPKDFNNNHYLNKIEKKLLEKRNITLLTNTEVIKINEKSINIIKDKETERINGDKIILTISPINLYELMKNDKIKEWSDRNMTKNNYSITLHFDKPISNLGDVNSPWNFSYTIYDDNKILFITIHKLDTENENGNTVNQLNKKQIIDYILDKLKLPEPTNRLVSENIKRENDKWINTESLYTITKHNEYMKATSELYPNIYYIGIHNGNHNYKISSIESSIQNAIYFAQTENPDLIIETKLKTPRKFNHLIYDLLILLSFIFILFIIKKNLSR